MKNKRVLVVTTLMILIPMFIGIYYWNQLPEQVGLQYNMQGEVGRYGSKAMLVFFMPISMLALHLFIVIISQRDKKFVTVSPKLQNLIFWMIPLMEFFILGMLYAKALGLHINTTLMLGVFLALFMIIVGNYIPKCKQDNGMGIKTPWTVKNEKVWYKTHRFTGEFWVTMGFLQIGFLVIKGFYPVSLVWVLGVYLAMVIVVPSIYSYYIYRKEISRSIIED